MLLSCDQLGALNVVVQAFMGVFAWNLEEGATKFKKPSNRGRHAPYCVSAHSAGKESI